MSDGSYHVDLQELNDVLNQIKTQGQKVANELHNAQGAMNGIIESEALQGKTGQAVVAGINNFHGPMLVGLRDIYDLIVADFSKNIKDFKSQLGETDDGAVYDYPTLEKLKEKLKKQVTDHFKIENDIRKIYTGISDIVPLFSPALSPLNDSFGLNNIAIQTELTNLSNKLRSFKGNYEKSDELLRTIKGQTKDFGSVANLSYSDSMRLDFFTTNSGFADSIEETNDDIKSSKQDLALTPSQKAKKFEEWSHNHPIANLEQMTIAERAAYYQDYMAFLNQIGLGVNAGLVSDLSTLIPFAQKQLAWENSKVNAYVQTVGNGSFEIVKNPKIHNLSVDELKSSLDFNSDFGLLLVKTVSSVTGDKKLKKAASELLEERQRAAKANQPIGKDALSQMGKNALDGAGVSFVADEEGHVTRGYLDPVAGMNKVINTSFGGWASSIYNVGGGKEDTVITYRPDNKTYGQTDIVVPHGSSQESTPINKVAESVLKQTGTATKAMGGSNSNLGNTSSNSENIVIQSPDWTPEGGPFK